MLWSIILPTGVAERYADSMEKAGYGTFPLYLWKDRVEVQVYENRNEVPMFL